ncbi:MAG: Ig-like domain-containing protein, partial [Clostridia bacterium]|nr:Ig-like domain-containing protein [Clostridia bacterium]
TVQTYNGKKDTVRIKVVDPYKPEKIELEQSGTLVLGRGETLQLSAGMEPATAKSDLTWSSSRSKYALVDVNGMVTALTEGTATITVQTYNGKKDTVRIKVVDPYKPEKIEFVESGIPTVLKGDVLRLEVKMTPSTARSELTWTSSDTDCAMVSNINGVGVITPGIDGTAKITVRTHNGKKASITVRVIDPYIPDKVVIDGPDQISVTTGDTLQLTAAVEPATAKQSVQWHSDNQKCVRVDSHGVLTAVSEGTARITVYAYGGKKDRVTVKVVDPPEIKGDVSVCLGMTIRDINLRLADPMQQALDQNLFYNKYLIMMTNPADRVVLIGMLGEVNRVSSRYNLFGVNLTQNQRGADSALIAKEWTPLIEIGGERMYYSEKHPEMNVLTMKDDSGKITGVLYGDLIAAGFGEQPTHIEMDRQYVHMQVGEQQKLNVVLTPSTAQVKFVWTSGNPEAAVVDQNGTVTAVGGGTAYIRAELTHSYGVSCPVYVSAPTRFYGDLSGLVGKNINEVNQLLEQPVSQYKNDLYRHYQCDYLSTVYLTDSIGKVKGIVLRYAQTDGKYNLFGVYPDQKPVQVSSELSRRGWTLTTGSSKDKLYWEDKYCVSDQVFTSGKYPGSLYVRYGENGMVYNIVYIEK